MHKIILKIIQSIGQFFDARRKQLAVVTKCHFVALSKILARGAGRNVATYVFVFCACVVDCFAKYCYSSVCLHDS